MSAIFIIRMSVTPRPHLLQIVRQVRKEEGEEEGEREGEREGEAKLLSSDNR